MTEFYIGDKVKSRATDGVGKIYLIQGNVLHVRYNDGATGSMTKVAASKVSDYTPLQIIGEKGRKSRIEDDAKRALEKKLVNLIPTKASLSDRVSIISAVKTAKYKSLDKLKEIEKLLISKIDKIIPMNENFITPENKSKVYMLIGGIIVIYIYMERQFFKHLLKQ